MPLSWPGPFLRGHMPHSLLVTATQGSGAWVVGSLVGETREAAVEHSFRLVDAGVSGPLSWAGAALGPLWLVGEDAVVAQRGFVHGVLLTLVDPEFGGK